MRPKSRKPGINDPGAILLLLDQQGRATMLTTLKPRRRGQNGFTLIELMIVIGIIGVLAAILTPVLIRARFKTYHTACVQNERNLATALELYSLENKQLYPPALTDLLVGTKPYIKLIPDCPSAGVDYTGTYTPSADNKTYVIECPGFHDIQLAGLVDDTYPRAAGGRVFQYNAND
jgi:prepilin-type N-terminal cleavage/methylation domain-containing protein